MSNTHNGQGVPADKTPPLRIGLIGLGGIATRSHLPALAARPDVAVCAGAEIDAYQAARTKERFGIPRVYDRYETMLHEEPLDAVYICLPNGLHHEAASAALSCGLHVFCEKPVGLCAQEAADLARQAEAKQLVLLPGYYLRYHPSFIRAAELLAQRRLGKILQVQASAVYSGPYRGWDPKSDWYFDPHSGGPLYDWGSHLVDLLLFMTGLQFNRVFAAGQRSLPGLPLIDSIAVAFEAGRDVVGTINLGWGARGNLLMFQIHGTAGSLLVSPDYFEHRTPTGGGINQLSTYLVNARTLLADKAGAVIRRRSSDAVHPKATDYFVRAIQGEAQAGESKWDAVRVHRVLEAIAGSLAHERPVEATGET